MRAVTAGDVVDITRFCRAIGPLDAGSHTSPGLLECQHFGLPLHIDTGFAKPIDQHTFVFVLRKNQDEGVRTDARTDVAERGVGHSRAIGPEIDRGHLPSAGDHLVSESDLAVPLECSSVHGERARCRPRLRRLVDDPYANA